MTDTPNPDAEPERTPEPDVEPTHEGTFGDEGAGPDPDASGTE